MATGWEKDLGLSWGCHTLERSLRELVNADTWSPEGCLIRSDILHWQLIAIDSSAVRIDWTAELDETIRRAGESPAIYRLLGLQRLHLYQRWAKPEDLAAADDLLSQAYQWNTADQWLAAQLSEVASQRGDAARATEMLDRATYIAGLTNNYERNLDTQLILPARHLGPIVNSGPKQEQASALLQP